MLIMNVPFMLMAVQMQDFCLFEHSMRFHDSVKSLHRSLMPNTDTQTRL